VFEIVAESVMGVNHLPFVLAHGVFGPFDELLAPVLLGALIGLIVITWWNGRKASAEPPPSSPETPAEPTEPGTSVPDEDKVSHYVIH
jgi:hypothetical protein